MNTPVISSISPNSGSIEGGTTLIIKGTNLSHVTAVAIGGKDATDLSVSSSQIACTTPAGAAGIDDVVVIAGNYGTTWTQTTQLDTNNEYVVLATSDSGQYQTAGVFDTDGGIWISDTYGASWSQSDAPLDNWYSVTMSSDGKYQMAGIVNGGIWISDTYGASWTQSDAPLDNWHSVAMSSDGKHQTACVGGGGIWISDTYGANWVKSDAPLDNWHSVAMSSDGKHQICCVFATYGGIWMSDTYGASWIISTAAPVNKWNCLAMSSDGKYQTAGVSSGGIWTSADSGASWSQSDAPLGNWYSLAMSSDGLYQIIISAFADISSMYTSSPSSSKAVLGSANSLTYTYNSKIPVMSSIIPSSGTTLGDTSLLISSITPSSGTTLGGTSVVIKGTNLSDITTVTIGGNNATNLNVVSSTQITCTTPAGAAGTDDVVAIAGNYGSVWTQNTSAPSGGWNCIAISSDTGQYQTAGMYPGHIWTSNTYGTTWSQNLSAPSANWTGIAMSSDGKYQAACAYGDALYVSSTYGSTWQISAGALNWMGIAMSSDGTYITACLQPGGGQAGVYTYNGSSWVHAVTSGGYNAVAMSSDGLIQLAANGAGNIVISVNSGVFWSTAGNSPSALWHGISVSSDGTIQTACAYEGGIWQSFNTGATWTLTTAPSTIGAYEWLAVSISSDTGQYQTAVNSDSGVYTSTDTGSTWNLTSTPTGAPTGLYYRSVSVSSNGQFQSTCANGGKIYTAVPSSSNSLSYTYKKVVISNICFPADTPITTDQGNIPIDKINPEIHTIRNNPIVAITKTITQDTHLVCFEKHSLGLNKPNKKTVTSKNHKVYYNGKLTKAHHFVKQFKNVKEIEYNGEFLYNVLMEKHDKLKANNLTFETLDPKNIIAKLYTSNFDEEYKDNIIVMINDSIMQKDHRLYQNIINRVVNDKSLSTCFDEEPEYEYEEPEYEEPVNTTRIDTIRNSAEKSYHTKSVNVKNKISLDNVTLHGKLSKYIKAQQNKDNQEDTPEEAIDFKVRVNLENNTHLESKLTKYIKTYKNKDNIDEIVKKKEFLNLKKEEKEARLKKEARENMEAKEERMKELLEPKNTTAQHTVEKSKTYKRVNLFKKTGTSKRLF